MKKFLFMLMMGILLPFSLMAAWPTSDTTSIRVAQEGILRQEQPKALLTDDGRLVVTWIVKGQFTDGNSHLYMQVFDTDGKPTLGENGIALATETTSFWTRKYSAILNKDNNLVYTYADRRDGDELLHVYVYCCNLQGEQLWAKRGDEFPAIDKYEKGTEVGSHVIQSGSSYYVATSHNEKYVTEATEENWSPSPWNPEEEMPEFVTLTYENYQIMRYLPDGSQAWEEPVVIPTISAILCEADNEGFVAFYFTKDNGINAQRYDSDGKPLWDEPTVVEAESMGEPLPTGDVTYAINMPTVQRMENGGYAIAYIKPQEWDRLMVYNVMTADGKMMCDGGSEVKGSNVEESMGYAMGLKGNAAMFLWAYYDHIEEYKWFYNLFDRNAEYTWDDQRMDGIKLATTDIWGSNWRMSPTSVFPQKDKWIMLFPDMSNWFGADFKLARIKDDGTPDGNQRLINTPGKEVSGCATAYNESQLYFVYTQDERYDMPDSGGIYVMCIDIEGGWTDIDTIDNDNSPEIYYNLQGMRIQNPKGLVIRTQGGKSVKIIL